MLNNYLALAILSAISSFSAENTAKEGLNPPATPPVGFVVHASQQRLADVSKSHATAELSVLFNWKMRDQKKQIVDFNLPQQWLDLLYKSERMAYPIIDTSLYHSSEDWRQKLTAEVNENLIDASGKIQNFASIYSPTFRKSVFSYTDQLIDWIKEKDTQCRIPAYMDGAEWFYPATLDYNPLTIQAFREWLKNRYSTIESINETWGADFKEWNDVQPLRITTFGDFSVGRETVSFYGNLEYFWESPAMLVEPRTQYIFYIKGQAQDVPLGMAAVQFRWYGAAGESLEIQGPEKGESTSFSLATDKPEKWQEIHGVGKAPVNAKTMRIGLKLYGKGSVKFKELQISRWPSLKELYNSENETKANGWQFVSNGKYGKGEIAYAKVDHNPVLVISAFTPKPPYKYAGISWEDWNIFSFESMADWLNICAKHMKQRDPSRQVCSYVGWVFGTLSMWGGFANIQRLDVSLANSPDVDRNGIQLCIADHDFSYATAPIDMARKYNKPVYATDFIDFPYGLYSGFEPVYRGALAAVQHGMSGMFAYCWYADAPKSYNYATNLTPEELNRLLDDTKAAIKAVEGYKLSTDIALIEPILTASIEDPNGMKSDPFDNAGMYHLIVDLGLIPDIITPYEISKSGPDILKKYKVVFLPDCPVLPQNVHNALVSFVENGGNLIGSGQWPQQDMRGDPLAGQLISEPRKQEFCANHIVTQLTRSELASLESPIRIICGKGLVEWYKGKLGAAYWGDVRRVRQSGNTPHVFVQTDFSENAMALRQFIRSMANSTIEKSLPDKMTSYNVADGTVNMAVFTKTDSQKSEILLFILHTGYGRNPGFEIKLNNKLQNIPCNCIADFSEHQAISASQALLTVPPFTHSCILRFGPVQMN